MVEEIMPLSEGKSAVPKLALEHLQTASSPWVFVVENHKVTDCRNVLLVVDFEGGEVMYVTTSDEVNLTVKGYFCTNFLVIDEVRRYRIKNGILPKNILSN